MGDKFRQVASKVGPAERDFIALGIATGAILMFVGTGGSVLPMIVRNLRGIGAAPDAMLVNALLLNIALIIFGWRRYRELTQEIAERREAEEAARRLAETDPLTGCLNRRSISPATSRLVESSKLKGQAVAFLMIDLDNFKQVNDLNGHAAGDRILVRMAEQIAMLLPGNALLARLGGDEFACVVPYDAAKPEYIDRFSEKLVDTIPATFDDHGISAQVTVSIGIASTEMIASSASKEFAGGKAQDAEDTVAQALLHKADIAMYQAKKKGKNRFFWFEMPMEKELLLRNEIETGIRQGLLGGEFQPFYEQQIDLETNELVGFEMLARWHSPKLGEVSPEIFIPIAEEIGVITQLSDQLINAALAEAAHWDPRLTLSVNISPVQMRDPWFSQKLLKTLIQHNFPPHRLDLEITESCLHENLGNVRVMITSLKNQGVRISLDDFGTGYSSLSQLRSLPFDRLKIDRSFIQELQNDTANPKLIEAIISLGEGLNLPITAEGIENGRILDTLKQFGQLKGQGYHYGKPESGGDVRRRLQSLGLLKHSGAAADLPILMPADAAEPVSQAG
ncbi:EAL domain-containing protein [Altererythrobacter sp. SALINAS58]|uniref:putative bifunctional diguanylate cyclase/phosphodiesterase n=1 Tax=Alteripontixanthobacter muriae TaxID=2705546 RepID=UPI0015753B33|nr:EAL domain-containing protein [Alteripontixanthobacter muriae]NTZ42374.1 EAL domain-containing protein [Alteripontixanthobacter muriae]